MDHRKASLAFLSATGLIPVKVRPGQKDPFPEWEPRKVANDDHQLTLAEIRQNEDLNVGALFSGRYVDLDIDSVVKETGLRNPYLDAALDYFLPRTPYVWGRASKPRSHRVYALHDDFERGPYGPTLRYLKSLVGGSINEFSYSLELRGGKPENGLFSVLPGSRHTGETIEWDAEIDPTMGVAFVETFRLVKALRLAVCSALIAPYWGEGVRNDMSLALAGTLWRIRKSTRAAHNLEASEETPEGIFILEEDDAIGMYNCIMKIADDQHGDERSRMLNLKNTWRKLEGEASSKVTGGKVLAELIGDVDIGKKVVRALYRLLSDNEAAEQIEKLAEQFVMWYGPGVIMDLEMVTRGRGVPWMTFIQAQASLAGKNLLIGDSKVRVVDMLFKGGIVSRVEGLTFDPSTEDLITEGSDGLYVNQWRGFQTKPSEQSVADHEIEPFLTYVKEILADNDAERNEWLLGWMADMLQVPHKKPGTALVLVGPQGAGKTFLGEHILGKIIGQSHYTQINNITTLTDKFNTIIDNRILVQCDEAIHSYQKDVASRLKSIISDGYMTIEPKGVNSYKKPNHMHLLFTSNDEHRALFIDSSPYERRFTVMKVSARRAMDLDYWSFMHLWVPMGLPKVMRWLMDYRYERRLISRPLATQAKAEMQREGVDPEVSWIISRMASGFPLGERTHNNWFDAYHSDYITKAHEKANMRMRERWPNTIMPALLEQDFKQYVRDTGRPVYSGSVVSTLRRVLPSGSLTMVAQPTIKLVDNRTGQVTMSRVRLHSWPEIEDILAHLRRIHGDVVDDMYRDFQQMPETAEMFGQPETKEEEF